MENLGTGYRPLLLLLALGMSPAATATDAEYHLTGVMGSEEGTAFAVIEDARGQQHLLRAGSAIGPGYVKSISSQHKAVVLVFPGGELTLRLSGSGKVDEPTEAFSIEAFYAQTENKAMDAESMSRLVELANNAEKLEDRQLSAQMNSLLGLSEQAQVAGFNDRQVDSPRAVLQQLRARISSMTDSDMLVGTFAISDSDGGDRRLYLTIEH